MVKAFSSGEMLRIERSMLEELKNAEVRVPDIIASCDSCLVMEYIENVFLPLQDREHYAADMLAALHQHSNESRMYGYYYDTPLASFMQKNEQTQYNWGLFLGQMRILPMARECYDKGVIDRQLLESLELLCRDLYRRIDMSRIYPSLLHGDIWSGNVLFEEKGACLIDPAIYYGDKEMELAFILLFDTFGKSFF